MNLSLASFLVEPNCRAVRVEYDPDHTYKNDHLRCRTYKTLDGSIKVDDLVVVPTETRHGFTVVKVKDIGFRVNYDSSDEYKWIVGKVDAAAYKSLLTADKAVVEKVGLIEENKKKRELMEAMGLTGEAVASLTYSAVPAAAPAQPLNITTEAQPS